MEEEKSEKSEQKKEERFVLQDVSSVTGTAFIDNETGTALDNNQILLMILNNQEEIKKAVC